MAVARHAFGARGYDATSLRSIATSAGVDPGLLVHYFGSKEGVFRAALEAAIEPGQLFDGLEGLSNQEISEHIVRRYLAFLNHEEPRDVVMGLVRSAVSSEHAADMLRDFLFKQVLTSLEPMIDSSDAKLRASLIMAQLVGIAMLKFVVRAGAVMQATEEEIVALVSPAIEQYLR